MYAPPFTAVHHAVNEGWLVGDHLQAQAIDALNFLAWAKTKDAQRDSPRHRPERIPRPGMAPQPVEDKQHVMTVEDYIRLSGRGA